MATRSRGSSGRTVGLSPAPSDPRKVSGDSGSLLQTDNTSTRSLELERQEIAGYVAVGKDNDVAVLDSRDPEWRIYVGSADPATAPFRVSKEGKVVIESSDEFGSRLEITNNTIKVFEGGVLRVKIGDLS